LDFNYDKYKWVYGNESRYKAIYGVISYIYPLREVEIHFLQQIYLSLIWAKIAEHGPTDTAGMVFDETGYMFPNSINDRILSFSIGYKINVKSVSFLLGVGYKYRKYDLRFREYNNGYQTQTHIIPQTEEALQIDFGLQYVL
jgi:hypothetical protein